MTRMYRNGMLCVDAGFPVAEIIAVLNKYGVTIKTLPKVFECVQQEVEKNTVVYSPLALMAAKAENIGDSVWRNKRQFELEKVASDVCQLMSENKVTVAETIFVLNAVANKIDGLTEVQSID